MLSVFDLKFQKATPFKDKLTLLQSADDLQILRSPSSDIAKIIMKVKLLLDDNDTRYEGLLLLNAVLSQCTDKVFEENAFFWAHSLLQIIQGCDGRNCKETACTILTTIISNVVDFPEVRKEVGEKLLPEIISSLIKTMPEDQWTTFVMACLAICMKEMPGFCVPYKGDLEKFLVLHLDCSLSAEVESVAECFQYLPLIGERSASPAHYKDYWIEQVHKMIGSLNKILDILYHGLADETDQEIVAVALPLPEEPENEFSAFLCCSRRFQTIASCLAKMLCSNTSHGVLAPVRPLLLSVDRALGVTLQKLSESKASNIPVGSVLPTVHSSALVILEAVILAYHDHLTGFEEAIGTLLFRNLQTQYLVSGNVIEEIRCNFLRPSVYRVMRLWIEKLHPISIKHFVKELCSEILKDITPYAKAFSVKGISMTNYIKENSQLPKFDMLSKEKSKAKLRTNICTEALLFLSSLLYGDNLCLTSNLLKVFQETVVDTLYCIQRDDNFLPAPYSDEQCRLQLYKVFLHLIVCSENVSCTPLSVAMPIFQTGQKDSSTEVSRLCGEAISVCVMITHPKRVAPTQPDKAPIDSLLLPANTKAPILSIDSVQSSSVAWEATSNSMPSAPSQMTQATSSSSSLKANSLPAYTSAMKKDSLNITIVNNAAADIEKEEEEECELVEEEEEEEVEEEEEEDEVEEEDEEDEDEHMKQIHEDDDAEDMSDADSPTNAQIVKYISNVGEEDNSNSNVNGTTVEVINENGFDTSGESCSSLPEVSRKRKRTVSNDEPMLETVSPSKNILSLNNEFQENCLVSEVDCSSEQIPVETMIQDFVACSPDPKS